MPLTHPLLLLLLLLLMLPLWPLLGILLLSLPYLCRYLGDCHLEFLLLNSLFFLCTINQSLSGSRGIFGRTRKPCQNLYLYQG